MGVESIMRIASTAWSMWVELAPWLCVGLIVAGLLKSVFPNSLVQKWLGGKRFSSTVKAALIGTPLPLCSCSVLPAAMQLHRSGASRGATVSFLIATPENGADSLSMSWGLLGPGMTLVRLAGALISSLIAGMLANLLEIREESARARRLKNSASSNDLLPPPLSTGLSTGLLNVIEINSSSAALPSHPPTKTCCANDGPDATDRETTCCSTEPQHSSKGLLQSANAGIRYAFTRLLSDIAFWLVLGVVTAAVMHEWIPADALGHWGSGPLTMLAILAISVPTYVCATASTPIASSLLAAGLSPGAVLVFLLAGPATNFSSAGIVRRELGNRALSAYLVGVIGVTFLLGMAVDWLLPTLGHSTILHVHQHEPFLPQLIAFPLSVLLALRMLWLVASGLRKSRITP